MDPAGPSSFSAKATYSSDAIAATEGTGSPLTAVDTVNNDGEEADKKNLEERGCTPSRTNVNHDKENSERKNQGDKQNQRCHQKESGSAGDTEASHQVLTKEKKHSAVYMAVLEEDLNKILGLQHPEALSSPITENLDTPLHVAIQTSRSIHFIRQLVDKLPKESLSRKNRFGNTVLHEAAIVGNAEAALIISNKNPVLPWIKNKSGDIPLHRAAGCAHEEVVCFLLSLTSDPNPFDRRAEARLLNFLISAGFYGYAFDVIKDHPETERYYVPPLKRTIAEGKYVDTTPLTILARKPEAFESKCQLGFCQRILHYVFPGNSAHKDTDTPESGDEENQVKISETRESEQSMSWKGTYSQQSKKKIGAVDLLKLLIEEVMKHPSDAKALLAPPLETAARLGNHVFIEMIIQAYPSTVLYKNKDGHNIFHISVIHRQEDVFSILLQIQMNWMKHLAFGMRDRDDNNILHLVGMHGPSRKISGPALQMQRELQWFKDVEKLVLPILKEAENREGKAPRDVFTEKHKKLVKEGEEWMKNAASSCSFVATLVVTVMFAAAFTVPGGNNDIGVPHFLDDTQFLIFSVSVILGLFSSSISLLMFLGMLTHRYAEDDFLEKLPRRLVIGLVTLFFSLAAMLVAFSASIHILLFRRISWIWIPVGLLALIPVVMFWFMQSRLLYETVKHTYAKTIFHKKTHQKKLLA